LINLSQFYIITDAGPVSSTVVGHLKTILIVGLGWILHGKNAGNESLAGVMLAVFGITRSVIMETVTAVLSLCAY
jgi:solute carrier family 35 protein E3